MAKSLAWDLSLLAVEHLGVDGGGLAEPAQVAKAVGEFYKKQLKRQLGKAIFLTDESPNKLECLSLARLFKVCVYVQARNGFQT